MSLQTVSQYDVLPGSSAPTVSLDVMALTASTYDEDWLWTPFIEKGEAGISLNDVKALGHGPLWQGINILAGDIGQIPFRKMRRSADEVIKDTRHPIDWLFRAQPNEMQTPSSWKETMMSWAILWGNAISYIARDAAFRPVGLIPLRPDRTTLEQFSEGYWYRTRKENGEYFWLRPDEVLHIHGLTTDGHWGLRLFDIVKNVIGYGLALRKHGNSVFKNGAIPRGVVRHPMKMSKPARDQFRNDWNAIHGGIDNMNQVAILQEGAEFLPTTLSNVEAQWLEAVKLDREQCASILCLPAHKLNALENQATKANLEEQNRSYMQTSLSRWMNKFVEEVERKLFTTNERRSDNHYMKWYPEAFLRADTKTRYEAYGLGVSGEWLTRNEVRGFEDLGPIEGGDKLGNPYTTSHNEEQTPEDQPEQNDQAVEAAWRAFAARIDNLIDYQANRLDRSTKNKNFLEWLDKFTAEMPSTAEGYLGPSAAVLVALGEQCDWPALLNNYIEATRAEVLKITDTVTMAELPGEIKAVAVRIRDTAAKRLYERVRNGV